MSNICGYVCVEHIRNYTLFRDIQCNDSQHNNLKPGTQHNGAKCEVFYIVMLSMFYIVMLTYHVFILLC